MSNEHSRRVSATYQIIIIAGFCILFIQLYALASSMYRDAQSSEQIERFEQQNIDLERKTKESMVELIKTQLANVELRENKETQNTQYLDEEVRVLQDSDLKANEDLQAASENDIFKQPYPADFTESEKEKIEEVKKKSKMEQWRYFFFKID